MIPKKICMTSNSESLADPIIRESHLNLKNIGSFSLISKKERIGRNPKTKKEYVISERKSVSFKPSKSLLTNLDKFI